MKKNFLLPVLFLACVAGSLRAGNPPGLPSTAMQSDRSERLELYINVDESGVDEYPATISVYTKDIRSGKITYILTSNPRADIGWQQMKGTKNAIEVTSNDIPAIEKAVFLPGCDNLILIEGCPDARNIYTYVIDTDKQKVLRFPTTEGLLYFEPDERLIHLSSYRYRAEGGRYSVDMAYTYEGIFVNEAEMEMEE